MSSFAGEIEQPPGSSAAPAGRVAATGQSRCYDNVREIPCPQPGEPFYGQDANYATIPISFADNGDGTITDRKSGRIWQKQDDGLSRNWTAAAISCEELSLGGHDDWRLPSKKELISITDYGRADPALDPAYFPETRMGWYWTATLRAIDPTYAWSIFSANGRIHGNHKAGGAPFSSPGRIFGGLKSGDFYARCVRGGAVAANPPPQASGPLTTGKDGLTWQRRDDGVGRKWAEALAYCENLTLAGESDWRLPDIKELEALTDDRQHTPAIDPEAFPETKTAGYWSATSLVDNPRFGWFVYFNNGYVNPVDKTHEYYTRCVRGGKVPQSGIRNQEQQQGTP